MRCRRQQVHQLQQLLLLLLLALGSDLPTAAVGAPYNQESELGETPRSRAESCSPVPIRAAQCMGSQYNTTTSSIKQQEVVLVLQNLEEVVKLNCAPFLRLFVCSIHLPFCNRDQNLLVRPCREFCHSLRRMCTPTLRALGYDWPPGLACESLPPEGDKNLCLRPSVDDFNKEASLLPKLPFGNGPAAAAATAPGIAASAGRGGVFDTAGRLPSASGAAEGALDGGPGGRRGGGGGRGDVSSSGGGVARDDEGDGERRQRGRECSAAELTVGREATGGGWCAKRCMASFLFAREDREFASAWMLAWSVVCLVCSGLALATFALDARRFSYPERPVVWVAACHMVHSGAHLLRAALGPELACSWPNGRELALVSRHAGQWCAAIFLLLYFSWMAGLLWWLALALCWHLSAARRWGHQLLAERAVWLHLLAWGAPLMLSVVLLVLHRIEGDELTHLCVVDGSRPANLLVFQVAPVATALVLGLAFLATALRAVVSAASTDRQQAPLPPLSSSSQGQQQQHLLQQQQQQRDAAAKAAGGGSLRKADEQQATKISLFSFLFVLPTACVLAANVYEALERHKWTASLEAVLARPGCVGVAGISREAPGCGLASRPSPAFYMLKIFMSLTAGLPAGLVVWANGQSAAAWCRCLCWVLARRRRSAKAEQLQLQHLQQHQLQQQQHQPQQQQQQHQPQQQQYQHHAYATVDSVRCDPRVVAAAATSRPAKPHQRQQQACMSAV